MRRPLAKIVSLNGEQYLWDYHNHGTAYKVVRIEEKPVKGYRIVQISYRHFIDSLPFDRNRLQLYNDVRYGLVNKDNELITPFDFFSLERLEEGTIRAIYPDPNNDGEKDYNNKERFDCILNYCGIPLFRYFSKDSDGNKTIKYKKLDDEIVAVSKCYNGIALFVKKHKIGIVDYNGDIKLEAEYTHIALPDCYNCFKAYKVKCSSLIGPDAKDNNSETYILSKDKSQWPIHFVQLDSKFRVEGYYEKDDIYLLKNKQNSLYCLCFIGRWPLRRSLYYTDEYIWLRKTGSANNPDECFFIASDTDKKTGIICVHKEKSKFLGLDLLIRKDVIVCPLEYDRILETNTSCIILIKNNQKGLFSLESKTIILNCIIPDNVSIIPSTLGEGYIGCCRKLPKNLSDLIYFFSDMKGNEIVVLDSKWIIKSGFKDGFAKIESDKEYATVDTKGNIRIMGEKHKYSNTHDCDWNKEDYERDIWDAMTDGQYGDYPDDGFNGDYESLGY